MPYTDPEEKKACDRRYYLANRERIKAATKAYRAAHKEQYNETTRKRRASNSAAERAYHNKYRDANRDANRKRQATYRDKHREEVRERSRLWARNNRASVWHHMHKRRARIRGGEYEQFTRDEIYNRDGGICHLCKRKCPPTRWHLDHLIPISKGGPHTRKNVAVSCPKCNQTKNRYGPSQLRILP